MTSSPLPVADHHREEGLQSPCLLAVPPRRNPPTYCIKNHRGRHRSLVAHSPTTRRRRLTTSHLPPSSIADDNHTSVARSLFLSTPRTPDRL
ncbi:hypothetical protein Dimus_017655, partial [Dionaea muscipula]